MRGRTRTTTIKMQIKDACKTMVYGRGQKFTHIHHLQHKSTITVRLWFTNTISEFTINAQTMSENNETVYQHQAQVVVKKRMTLITSLGMCCVIMKVKKRSLVCVPFDPRILGEWKMNHYTYHRGIGKGQFSHLQSGRCVLVLLHRWWWWV